MQSALLLLLYDDVFSKRAITIGGIGVGLGGDLFYSEIIQNSIILVYFFNYLHKVINFSLF